MRRTREQMVQVFLFVVTLLAFGLGIKYYLKKSPSSNTHSSTNEVSQSPSHGEEGVAPSKEASSEKVVDVNASEKKEVDRPPSSITPSQTIAEPAENEESSKPLVSAHGHFEKAVAGAEGKNFCRIIEYRGDGFQHSQISGSDWNQVVKIFHDAKAILLRELHENRSAFSEKMAVYMQSQMEDLKLMRPPVAEEPDLSWRGIGVWTQDGSGGSLIVLGSGFVKLAIHQHKRALFELVRLAAQTWSPCALRKIEKSSPWDHFVQCLDIIEEQACTDGSYSEGGWAVSTTLAWLLAAPGCEIPVFASPTKKQCLQKLPSAHSSKKENKK